MHLFLVIIYEKNSDDSHIFFPFVGWKKREQFGLNGEFWHKSAHKMEYFVTIVDRADVSKTIYDTGSMIVIDWLRFDESAVRIFAVFHSKDTVWIFLATNRINYSVFLRDDVDRCHDNVAFFFI